MITEHLIKRQSGEYDPEVIKRLKIENCSIVSIANLNRCTGLMELSLSMNQITVISGFESLSNLQRLDLSYNRIAKIENLDPLFNLAFLDLRCNKISSTADATALGPLVNLKSLYLRSEDSNDNNPVCELRTYRKYFLDNLPQIQYLDGSHVSLEHASTVMEAKLADIKPDPRASETPPLEPWFESAAPSLTADPVDFPAIFDDLQTAIDQTKVILAVDSVHVLKKAQSVLEKAQLP